MIVDSFKNFAHEIAEKITSLNANTEGTFKDLRQRLVQLAKRQPELFTDANNSNWVNGTVTENKDAMPRGNDSATTIEPGESVAKVMSQIRKWDCHFDGRDPHSFLERVKELSQVYGYTGEYLLRGLPEMLRGEALTWFRNGRENWHSWEEFRSDFEAEYIPRKSQLDLLYENMLPEMKRFIRPDEVDSLGELRTRVTEVEQIEQQIRERNQRKPENQNLQPKIPPAATAPYNKDECCWRCKQKGHSRFNCKRPPRKFCSQCGKDDAIINKEVEEMLKEGIIETSQSAWSSPVVVVKKKDGKHRFCIDFRKLNEVTEKDAYPLPHITETLDKLRGAKYLSTLDLKSGYWQIPLSPSSRPLTAFTVPGKGLLQFRVMPFGLHAAPATFQRLLDRVLGPELEPNVLVYLDDIIIISRTFEEHLKHLKEVFRRLREQT
ncbi:uncharacterized protein K02A2.6-like [Odontomachus brunneus]|uniref:uncharacterized protein K02A2.6-like n=1 Tax=Odontomachus brunneus TaxID=486640 RepID=UPI0013F1EDE4|nr:uncharacterized protein K02A2.6-like [Odontomachus brunneus]